MRKRTRFAAAVVVTFAGTGCFVTSSSNPPEPDNIDAPWSPLTENPPAPPARVASYDVLVSADTVRVLPSYMSDTEFCLPTGVDVLPATGECNEQADVVSLPCGLSTDVTLFSIDSDVVLPNPQTADASFEVHAGASSALHLDGAFGPVDVPLHATGLPTPTITTTPRSNGVDIAWTTDVEAATSLVEVTAGLMQRHCHVTQPAYRFDGPAPSTIRVQPFLAAETTPTPYGDIRVWRGNGRVTD